jgi:hypothetical protein
MTLPTTNVSFSAIQTEFGGGNPISLSEYYRSGTYVRTNTTMPNGTIATSGTISVGTFRGATQGVLAPTYAFGTIPTTINEGSSGVFNVNTTNVANGTTLYWTIATNSGDFGTTSGSFTISSNTGSFSVSPTADASTEGTETFTVSIRTGSTSGTIQATSGSVNIGDTSQAPTPTYSLTRSAASVNEGGSFTISFATNQAGSFGYSISGVSSSDINGASLSGTVSNGSVLSYSVAADSLTEGSETFSISLNNGQASTSVTINDTSTAPVPPSSATWSVGFSNNGTAGPISTFVLVTLNRAATVSTTYTFSGVVVQNGVTFTVPNVTIGVGSTSSNPSAFSGVTNGAGPYSTITLRVTPVTVPYPLTPSGAINTSFQYSA